MKKFSGVHIKLLTGYAVFIVVMLLALWLVYDNTRKLLDIGRVSESFVYRSNVADSLVQSMLEVDNAERSVCLGDVTERERFDRAMNAAVATAVKLRQATSDSLLQTKIDTLVTLLRQKQDNIALIVASLDAGKRGRYYDRKVADLHGGKDSVVITPHTTAQKERRETVYEVMRTRKGFFARLADAFRRQRNDTVAVEQRTLHSTDDTVAHRIDIADTVADVLAEIKRREDIQDRKQRERITERSNSLEMVSLTLARRTEQLLKDIRRSEQAALAGALNEEYGARMSIIVKIGLLAVMAVASAIVLMLNISSDIRRQKRYSDSLKAAKDKAEQMMQQRERLLLTITHDIKAPAASISGFIDLLEPSVRDERGRGYLLSLGSSARHLLSLVTALLDYHRLERGMVEPQPTDFVPADLLESCAAERQPQAAAKGLTLTCRPAQDCRVAVSADAFRIKQIIDNLVSNALKYTDRGEVKLTAACTGGRLTLRVADTGRGMTPDETKRIYNAFTRLPEAQGIEGVGLGLSIVREVVDMLVGDIRVASEKGRGTTFTVTLPVAAATRTEATPEAAAGAETVAGEDRKVTSDVVYIVDDDRLQLTLITEMFGRLSGRTWELHTFVKASEALAAVARRAPGLLMTDVEMPEMSGRQLIGRLGRNDIPVVAMTAHDVSIEKELREDGFSACLFKPFKGAALAVLLSKLTGDDIVYKEREQAPMDDAAGGQTKTEAGQPADPFAGLLAFADGDADAEKAILTAFVSELTDARDRVVSASVHADRKTLSAVAHKLTPSLTLVNPAAANLLKPLAPGSVDALDDDALRAAAIAVVTAINGAEEAVRRRLSTK